MIAKVFNNKHSYGHFVNCPLIRLSIYAAIVKLLTCNDLNIWKFKIF